MGNLFCKQSENQAPYYLQSLKHAAPKSKAGSLKNLPHSKERHFPSKDLSQA
jgi:hypothetical protein